MAFDFKSATPDTSFSGAYLLGADSQSAASPSIYAISVVAAYLADLTQTLTNKTISGASNTLTNIGNSSLTNSSVTIGSTAVSLGATAATIAGLTLTSPTLTTPTLGVATATSINKVAITAPATSATLTIADGKTVNFQNSLTFPSSAGTNGYVLSTDGAGTLAWVANGGGGGGTPGGSDTQVQYNSAGSFAAVAGFTFDGTSALTLGVAGSSVGGVVFKNVTSGSITLNPASGALGSAVLTLPAATDQLVGRATTDTLTNKTLTSPTLTTPVLGTPSSGTLTNCTGLPVSTGISGLGTGVATFLATPSSANLASAVTDETGTGALVFASSPTLVTPTLGVATVTSVNKVAITAPATSATLTIADGKTVNFQNSLTFPSSAGTNGYVLSTDGAGTLSWVAQSGGGGSPAGSSGNIQYNAAGSFGAMSGTSWDDTNRSLTLTGATVTTSNPVLNLTQTWNAGAVTFNGLLFNVTDTASAAASSLINLQKAGTTQFRVDKTGVIYSVQAGNATIMINGGFANYGFGFGGNGQGLFFTNNVKDAEIGGIGGGASAGVGIKAAGAFCWASSTDATGTKDLFLTRAAAATLQHGAADAAAPVAQTVQVQSVVTGTADTAGANFTVNGSKSTGTGTPGSIIFKTAGKGAASTTQNTLIQALKITGGTTNNTDVGYPSVVVGAGAALNTTATDGFLYIPTCAGTPSGTPTTQTGAVPLVFDTTNAKLYIYTGGSWKGGTTPGAFV